MLAVFIPLGLLSIAVTALAVVLIRRRRRQYAARTYPISRSTVTVDDREAHAPLSPTPIVADPVAAYNVAMVERANFALAHLRAGVTRPHRRQPRSPTRSWVAEAALAQRKLREAASPRSATFDAQVESLRPPEPVQHALSPAFRRVSRDLDAASIATSSPRTSVYHDAETISDTPRPTSAYGVAL